MAKGLIILGSVLIALGLLWPYLAKTRLGRLPGDFIIKSGHFTFYFPLVTALILSITLSIVLWIFQR